TAGAYAVVAQAAFHGGMREARTLLRVQPHKFPSRRLQVDPVFVTPPAEAEARIVREQAELRDLWTRSAAEPFWRGPFSKPVSGAPSGRFGARSVFNGVPRAPHGGEDFASPAGTPVLAPNRGRVVLARDLYFTGNTVVIDHGVGVFSLLAHF